MTENDHPVHLIVDCATGHTIAIPLTAEEMAEKASADAAHNAARAASEDARAADLAMLAKSKDPHVQALARLLGVQGI